MPRAEPEARVKKLEEAQARLNAELQRARGRAAQQARKRDTHRKILAGAMTLDRVARGRCRSSASWSIWIGFLRRTATGRCMICRRVSTAQQTTPNPTAQQRPTEQKSAK